MAKLKKKMVLERSSVPFRFQVNKSKLVKKDRELLIQEGKLLSFIKQPTKLLHRGICNYNELIIMNDMLLNSIDDYNYSWYLQSGVFSYIHDVCSIKSPPDYKLKGSEDSLNGAVTMMTELLIDYSRSIGISRLSYKKHYAVSEWFIVYLHRLYKINSLAIKYSRDKSFNLTNSVQNKDFSNPVMLRLVDFLKVNNFVIDFTGNVLYGTRTMSMLVINPELYDLFGISNIDLEFEIINRDHVVVKDDKGRLINKEDYSGDIMEVVEYGARVLSSYEEAFKGRKLSIDGYIIPEYWLTRVHREDITVCSRIFDGNEIQGRPKDVRSRLKIDDVETVGLDFKALHPSILLHQAGKVSTTYDPYPVIDGVDLDQDLIKKFKEFYGLSKYDPLRNIVKKLTLCMINANSKNDAVGACYADLQRDQMKKGSFQEYRMLYVGLPKIDLHKIADEIIEHNSVIADQLGTGVGNKLQKIDSDIMMYCIERFVELGIIAIPIHDCFIAKVTDKVQVESVMVEGFVKFVGEGSEANCKIEEEK